MKQYYQRRIDQGENGMRTVNVFKNKLLARIFSDVEGGTGYANKTCLTHRTPVITAIISSLLIYKYIHYKL